MRDETDTAKRRRILALSSLFASEDIADMLRIKQAEVEAVLESAGKAREIWEVTDNKTGRTFQTRSKRSAYRLVCLRGLVDWDWRRL